MITLLCPAKINLFLAILGRDPSGYHEIETILARCPLLEDRLQIERSNRLTLECNAAIPPEENTVLKAIRVLEAATQKKFHYRIQLEKNIPMESGLGGGSSDAAAILLFINQDKNLGISKEELMEIGAQVGMDVPFFVSGHEVAHATHYGEKIRPLKNLPKEIQIQLKTGPQKNTQEAYAEWDRAQWVSNASSKELLAAIEAEDAQKIIQNLHNDFDRIRTAPKAQKLSAAGILTGSGGARFFASVRGKTPSKSQSSKAKPQPKEANRF